LHEELAAAKTAASSQNDEVASLRGSLADLRDQLGRVDADLAGATELTKRQEEELTSLRALVGQLRDEQSQRRDQAAGQAVSGASQDEAALAATEPLRRDPLIDINGIGPVFEQRLFDAGIVTFAQLAEQTPERLREIVAAQSWQDIDAADWIAEAGRRAATVEESQP
jgi:predicted flap endonuclease-1-like 5' DNA nuclease